MNPLPTSQYYFKRIKRVSDEYPEPGLVVDSVTPCGKIVRNVAVILDPDNENPALLLLYPHGMNGVKKLMEDFWKSPYAPKIT